MAWTVNVARVYASEFARSAHATLRVVAAQIADSRATFEPAAGTVRAAPESTAAPLLIGS